MRIVLVEEENSPEKRKVVARMAFNVCQNLNFPIFVERSGGTKQRIEPWDSLDRVENIVERFYS